MQFLVWVSIDQPPGFMEVHLEMRRVMFGFVFAAFMAVCLASVPVSASAASTAAGPDYAAIDRYVQGQITDAHIPGLALGIVHGDQIAHVQGFGSADSTGRAVTGQTPFFIGSLSKSFTALAVMQLVQAGKTALDAPVQEYVPAFRVADYAASRQITVRELLNQTSGIPTSAGIGPLSGPVTSLAAQVDDLRTVQLASSPGRRYQYSNANYVVLGRLIELVSGEDYGAYLGQNVLGPLGMNHTYTSLAEAEADGLASGSSLWFGLAQRHAQGAGFRPDMVPAGFVLSTAEDMTHYLIAQLNGGVYSGSSVLSAAGVDKMHSPAVNAGVSAQGGGYAMGWFAGRREALTSTVWHNGSAGGMHTMVVMLPAQRWGVVILTNAESLLYEFVSRIDVIADNVAAMLVGRPLAGTLAGLYMAFDAGAAVMLALVVRNLLGVVRGRTRPRSGGWLRARRVAFDWVVPLWREVWAPIGIVVGLPLITGAPWSGNLAGTDAGVWLLALAALLFATGLARLALAAARRRTRQAGASNRPAMLPEGAPA
jgi:CubicO group peptidase (beta-lactamase class C family)